VNPADGWRVPYQPTRAARGYAAPGRCHSPRKYGGHHLNRDNPELVCEVIVGLVERARTPAQ
jgi:hypothetical protein